MLRKANEEDIYSESLFNLLNDDLIEEYIKPLYCKDFSELKRIVHHSRDLCDFQKDFCYFLEELSSGELIGIIDAYVESDTICLSAAILADYRGNGFMPEATIGFLLYLKENHSEILYAEFLIKEDNESSLRIMDKLNIPLSREMVNYFYYRLPLYEELPF